MEIKQVASASITLSRDKINEISSVLSGNNALYENASDTSIVDVDELIFQLGDGQIELSELHELFTPEGWETLITGSVSTLYIYKS